MRKYLSFFRLRFSMGLQYRVAALAGIITQYAWGFMEILVFRAFYAADASAFPMSFEACVCYIWLQQAFLAFFTVWQVEGEVFDAIREGNVAYELCRPIGIYQMWFVRSVALRLSRAVLRCFPVLLVGVLLPAPLGMTPPKSFLHFLLFLVTLFLSLMVVVAFVNLIYILAFFTVSPDGIRILAVSVVEFCSGAVIPLPFFPDKLYRVIKLLPFASMQNVPLRIYSGDLDGLYAVQAVGLQIVWAVVLVLVGFALTRVALKRVVVQGG